MTARSKDELTLDTLCDAYYQAARWANAHKDLASYHQKKLDILEALFEFRLWTYSWRGCNGGSVRDAMDPETVLRIAKTAIQEAAGPTGNPFWTYIEGWPGPMEAWLRRKHEKRLKLNLDRRRDIYMALFRDALLLLAPLLKDKSFSASELTDRGLPLSAPDPLDYF